MKSTTTFASSFVIVFLKEVTPADNRRVRLVFRAGNLRLEDPLGASGDGIRIAERGEGRLRPAAQGLPGAPVGGRCRVLGRSRDEQQEPASALFVRVVGEGRVGGADDVVRQVRDSLKGLSGRPVLQASASAR